MSKQRVAKDKTPAHKTIDTLIEQGFGTPNTSAMFTHPDGRIAVVLTDGRHQVFERFSDAQNWLRQHDDSEGE